MRNGPSHDLSYFAGIMDGEGTFSLGNTDGTYRTLISVSNNNKMLIDWIQSKFGGGTRIARASVENCEDQHVWFLASKPKIAQILHYLIPELIVKKVPASILHDFCRRFNIGRGKYYSPSQYQEMAKYHQLLLLANSKGPGSENAKTSLRVILGGQDAEC